MSKTNLGGIPLVLLLAAAPAFAADLAKFDRTLRKEPAYVSKAPQYCLLVFGPKADTRVWLVLDVGGEPWDSDEKKNYLYVDRHGTGDVTAEDARVRCKTMKKQGFQASFSRKPSYTFDPQFTVGTIVSRDGKTRYSDLVVEVASYMQDYRPVSLSVTVPGRGTQRAGGPRLRFAERPQEAPIIHFDGPLSLRVLTDSPILHVPISYDDDRVKRRAWYEKNPPRYEKRQLVRGEANDVIVELGTPGLGRGTFATFTANAVPADVHPRAEIEFPADGKSPPVKAKITFKERC